MLRALEHDPTPDEVRQTRVIQASELAGIPAARQVLQRWALGTPGATLTEDARAAIKRLSQCDLDAGR
jgi:hypothetical protein